QTSNGHIRLVTRSHFKTSPACFQFSLGGAQRCFGDDVAGYSCSALDICRFFGEVRGVFSTSCDIVRVLFSTDEDGAHQDQYSSGNRGNCCQFGFPTCDQICVKLAIGVFASTNQGSAGQVQ